MTGILLFSVKVLKKNEKKEESDVNINKPDKVYFGKDKVVIRDMKKYKKRIITACIVLVTLCGIGGYYYIWCSYHPEIIVHVGDGGIGKEGDYKLETPYISYGERHGISTAAAVELKITNVMMQHEYVIKDIGNLYKACDIKLDIKRKDNQTILKYHGTAIDLNGKKVEYDNEIVLDFILDADYS